MAQTDPTPVEEANIAPISDEIVASPPATAPGRMRRFGRSLWRAIRMAVILAVLAGIGLAIYYGWPTVNERYIQPIASNSAGLETAAERLTAAESQIADLESQLQQLSDSEAELPERLTAIETAIADLTSAQADTSSQIDSIDRQIGQISDRLDGLDTIQAELATGIEGVSAESTRQVELLRSMELLSRARLFLYQANYGLARTDLQTARNVLAKVQADYADWQPDVMTEVLFRVNKALSALPQLPVAAADDLDIAWQVLLTQVAPITPEPAPAEENPAAGTDG